MEKKQTHMAGRRSSGKWAFAFVLIASGAIILSHNFGWIDTRLYDILLSWYTLLVFLGIYFLCTRHYFSGLILLAIGFGYLYPHLGLTMLPVNPGQIIWPAVLILAGLSFFFVNPRKKKNCFQGPAFSGNKQHFHSSDGFVRSDNSFGGVRQVILDEYFKGAELTNKCGGTVIDLRRTKIEPGETYVDVDCKFGGIELYVPSQWNVIVRCDAFMGACEDKRWQDADLMIDKKQTLVIRGYVSFGGVVIKS